MIMFLIALLLIAAVAVAVVGLRLTARSPVAAPIVVEYRTTFTLAEPYVKYVNGRKATKYVL